MAWSAIHLIGMKISYYELFAVDKDAFIVSYVKTHRPLNKTDDDIVSVSFQGNIISKAII